MIVSITHYLKKTFLKNKCNKKSRCKKRLKYHFIICTSEIRTSSHHSSTTSLFGALTSGV
jgi:hypothetical protein